MKTITLAPVVLVSMLFATAVDAADRNVFRNKTETQHELSGWEKKKMTAELNSKFNVRKSGISKKLGNNPWAAKNNKQRKENNMELTNNWGGCREYAYKKRSQCYTSSGDAYTCERYYDARVNHCNELF